VTHHGGRGHAQFSIPRNTFRLRRYAVSVLAWRFDLDGGASFERNARKSPTPFAGRALWRQHGFLRHTAGRERGHSEFHGGPQYGLAAGPSDRRRLPAASERARSHHVAEGPPLCAERHGPATYRIADLTNPILKSWVIEQMKKANEIVLAGKVPYIARGHCWPAGVPGFTVYTRVQPIHFIQTPTKVIILNELNAEVRHVYLDVPHSPEPKPSWYGESVGRYESDELVVDTIGTNDRTYVDNYRTPHTDQIHVVERFKLIEDGRKLQSLVTVSDPGAFNMPWSALQRWRRVTDRPMTEDLCAENNVDFFGYDDHPVPQSTRQEF
jgi:hypothetical protein